MKKIILTVFLGFSLSVFSITKAIETNKRQNASASLLIQKGASWKFLDNGTDPGTTWTTSAFDNSAWGSNLAPLGYGDPTKTITSFGPDSANKFITTYFSKDITISDLNILSAELEFGIRKDDGFVLYINGVEAIRSNMPTGSISATTTASLAIDGITEKIYETFYIPKSYFNNGINRIAIEMHQSDVTSSDLGFDLFLKEKDPEYLCEEGHIACFTSINPTAPTPLLIFPTEQRFQMLFKEGSNYTDGSGIVPGAHDFTAYIPSSTSYPSNSGYLSVNHENNPGGVSIVNVNLKSDTQSTLWEVTAAKKVDFSSASLVKTVRNCSGGITPWGTIITAEETTNTGDINTDGYQDVGWLVEIDPATASVKDYDNNGSKDKLFALGRMNHENIAVSADGAVAYYGEDGGTQCVYKFVPTVANDLTVGKVYVLKLDTALSDNEPTSDTANWVLVPNSTIADRNNITSNAFALGGTNFNGVEDCEFGPDGMIYFTSKGKNRVYRFKDNGATISNFETFVGGLTYPIATATGIVNEPWAGGNDNLTFDDKGNLWVLQDGSRNYVWVVRPNHKQTKPNVLIHSSSPTGSEPTGLTFTPDFKYGFYSIQSPDNNVLTQVDATGNNVRFNISSSLVFANKSVLGAKTLSTNSFKKVDTKIYPNPTNGKITIDFGDNTATNTQINVFDILGKKIISKNTDTVTNKTLEIDLSNYNSYFYIFEIVAANQKEVIKVLKTK